jgi:hypothetical protein
MMKEEKRKKHKEREREIFTDSSLFQADFTASSGQENRLVACGLGAFVLDVLAQGATGDTLLLLNL